jgi:hypothetical protein
MPIDIRRNYVDSFTDDERIAKERAKAELEKQMAEFLAKGGKVEKLKPGIAKGASSLNRSKSLQYTESEIRKQAEEREGNGHRDSETTEWYNQ